MCRGNRGGDQDQTNKATNVGVYLENQFSATDALLLVVGGRGQYSYRSVADHFLSDGDQSGNVDYFAVSPKLGVIWRVAPGWKCLVISATPMNRR